MVQAVHTTKTKKIIYIADDDRAIVDALQLMLEDAGYKVEGAYDDSVIEKIKHKPPDLLLLDIWMSGSDGRDICRKLKKDAETRHIPVVLISAHPDAVEISAACGANACITKPFDIHDFLNVVEKNIS